MEQTIDTIHKKQYPFEFHGNTKEFYKIWIVNLLLTIITLGIFSAWAKVRTRRYFYGNTYLDGVNFDYTAKPLAILAARVVLVLLLGGSALWAGEDVFRNAVYSILLFVFLPWAMVRGLAFNARYSAYRNVRFSFNKDGVYKKMYLVYMPAIVFFIAQFFYIWQEEESGKDDIYIITVLATFAVMVVFVPWMLRNYYKIKIAHHRWGKMQSTADMPSHWRFAGLIFLLPILGLMVWILLGVIFQATTSFDDDVAGAVYVILFFLIYIVVYYFIRAKLFMLFWHAVRLPDDGRILCRFSALDFAYKILAVNLLTIILSLGLLYPWAKIRKTRFLANNMEVLIPAATLSSIYEENQVNKDGALGEEFAGVEGFDFDVGLI